MTKVLISGYYGFKNFGDEAILSVLVKHLKFLNADITVFSGNPEFTQKTYDVTSINSFNLKNVFREVKNTDILVSGGGSLLQDVTSLKSLVYYSFIIALSLLFNKKVIIFAQGIGPINNTFARKIIMKLLKQCDLVTVRDENSLELLKSFDVPAKLVCDPIYSAEILITHANAIGVQLREFKTMNLNILHKLAMLIINKFPDRKIKIFSLQKEIDLELCKRFETILKSFKPEIQTEIIEDNIINEISELEYFFAMRFHAVLAAIKAGVKTCAINYDIKVEKLAIDAKIPLISMDANQNFEEIYIQIEKLNSGDLIKFSDTKKFDWKDFDSYFLPNPKSL